MGKIQVDTDMLICALEDHNFETQYYLDIKTGEIVCLTDFDMPEEDELRENIEAEEGRYVYIEPIDSRDSFRVMERFTHQLPEGKVKNELADALMHQRPFRRFKDTLYAYPDIRKEWSLFHNQELKKIAQEWLQYNNIEAELLPLPEEKTSKGKKTKKHILSKKQIEYLSYAFDLVYDEIRNDIATLSINENEMNNLWLWNQLPPLGRADLNLQMAFRLLTSLITLVYKFYNEKEFRLGNRAEEILLHIAIENALGIGELDQVEMEDFEEFIEYIYEDLDFLLMYEPKFDGFDESPLGEMMGTGSFSTKDWFKPYNKPRNPHPFFWDMKERLSFPANREITTDYDLQDD